MLDHEGPVHLYVQIADQLREQIGSGELALGSPLPSEADLMARYGVARRTVRSATRVLLEEGLIHSLSGRGNFVGPLGTAQPERGDWLYQHIAEEIIREIRAGDRKPTGRSRARPPSGRDSTSRTAPFAGLSPISANWAGYSPSPERAPT